MSLKPKKRSWKFYALLSLAAFVAVVAGLAEWLFMADNSQPAPVIEPAAKIARPTSGDASLLMERMAAPPVTTPEDVAEKNQRDKEQVAYARKRLENSDYQVRVAGAEQLSAYPNAEAEKLLADSLANDYAPEVQGAAARSLAFFKNPHAKTLDNLQHAVESDSEEVAFAALFTLEGYVAHEPYGSERATEIINRLKQLAKSRGAPKNVQTSIVNFLSEQAPGE